MSFPFGNIIVDENADPNAVYLFSPRYKTVPVGVGDPHRTHEVIDWDATSRASAVIINTGEGNK